MFARWFKYQHRIGRIAVLASMMLYAGSATHASTKTLYDDLGGERGVEKIVHQLIVEIAADDVLKPHFKNINIAGFRTRLEMFVCQIADGPCEYEGRSMRDAHATLAIHRKAFNRLVEGLIRAMETVGVSYPSQNALLSRLALLEADIVTGDSFTRPEKSTSSQ